MRTLTNAGAAVALFLSVGCGMEKDAGMRVTSALLGDETRLQGDGSDSGKALFEFETLTGAPRPYAGGGADAAIRGVPAGGLPWVIGSGEARLGEDSMLKVEVEGLVFDPADATVIERGLAGRNTVAQFKAIVSCQTVVDGAAAVVNVSTAPVPATIGLAAAGGGNALIEEVLALPSPCIAPIVFVTSPTGNWFAISGF
jgi:hypothetical protein